MIVKTLATKRVLRMVFAFWTLLLFATAMHASDSGSTTGNRPPNIIIILIDDLGYADIGPFGATAYRTPNLDRMAKEGRIFTDFHAATSLCSASRAGLLTGCYAERISIPGFLLWDAKIGISESEMTLAELCKSRGYATAIFGKWHLGHHKQFLPLQHGFDEFFGLPYSNDMSPLLGEMIPNLPAAEQEYFRKAPPLPLLENNSIVDSAVSPEKLAQLTTLYTEHAINFIDQHKDQQFFLYLPHTMVHVPLAVSEKFRGKSGTGLFGDCVMEIDWSVGRILAAVQRAGIVQNTLVIFTSDNGPSLEYGNHAGSAGPLREGKGTMWEGGYREPCIMMWPGKIPPKTRCDEFASTLDIFPTVAKIIGAEVSPDRILDGKSILPLVLGKPNAVSPHDVFYCYQNGELRAVRDRRWKLVFPHAYHSVAEKPSARDGLSTMFAQLKATKALYDLKNDVGEHIDVSWTHPDILARLEHAAEKARAALGDKLTGRGGNEVRLPGN